MVHHECPFCPLPDTRIVHESAFALAVRDLYPVSPGHTLVLPRAHRNSLFDCPEEELRDLWDLLRQARTRLDTEFAPAGYNVGVNDGSAAGQTVPHLHIHLIPRYSGDVADPRGGVRWVIPARATDWEGSP